MYYFDFDQYSPSSHALLKAWAEPRPDGSLSDRGVASGRSFEEQGNREEAKIWRHIEAALKLMCGPNQS